MRRHAAVGGLILLAGVFPSSGDSSFLWRSMNNTAFRVGEKIDYQIKYGAFVGGTISQQVTGVVTLDKRSAYHVLLEAKTNKTFDLVHKMRERHESWIDTESLSSLRFTENAEEGKYTKQTDTRVDSPRGLLTHEYKTSKHQGRTEVSVPAFPQDPLSVVYYLRNTPLAVGARYEIPFYSGDDVTSIHIEVREEARIRVPAGLFKCYHIVPLANENEKVKGAFEVWITADVSRIPVLIKTKLSVGSFLARMTAYTPGPPPPGR